MNTKQNLLALACAALCGASSAQMALGGSGAYQIRQMPVVQPDGSVVVQQVAVPVQGVAPAQTVVPVQTVAPPAYAPPPPPRRDWRDDRRDRWDDDWDDDWDDRHGRRDRRNGDWRDDHRPHRNDDRRDDGRGARAGASLPKGYSRVGSYTAGGSAKETGAPSSRPIRKVRIVATSGSVIVNTVVVREGGAKTPHTLAVRLAAGESREIDLGSARNVTGLRISDGGKGTYEIQVR